MSRDGKDEMALVERLQTDSQFMARLILTKDIGGEITAAGFSIDAAFLAYVEGCIGKIRTYASDQCHVLEAKCEQVFSQNKPVNSGNSAAGNW